MKIRVWVWKYEALPLSPPTGFGWVRVLSPAGPLDVFNTHLHANYSHKVRAKAVAAAAAATRGKAGTKAIPKTTVFTASPPKAAAAAASAGGGKVGPKATTATAGPKAGPTNKTAGEAKVEGGGDDSPVRFDIPLDAFAPFRVSQIYELAQVRREGGQDESLKIARQGVSQSIMLSVDPPPNFSPGHPPHFQGGKCGPRAVGRPQLQAGLT